MSNEPCEPPKDKRVKAFAFIVYEENKDIEQLKLYLQKCCYTAFISPLHTPANNPNTDGENEKKPHYHVLITLPSPRSLKALNEEFNGVCKKSNCVTVGSVRSYTKYMLHLGYSDKEQYATKGMTFCDFPLDKYLFDKVEDFQVSEFVDWIFYLSSSYHRLSFAQLIQIMREEKLYEYIEYASRNTFFVINLLKGM